MTREVDTEALAQLVRRQLTRSPNLREAAQQAGLSPATLSRVQRGHAPDADALAALARWLHIPMEKLLRNPPVVNTPPRGSTIEQVEVHLRADPRLSTKSAARLADVFKAIYEEFVENEEKSRGTSA